MAFARSIEVTPVIINKSSSARSHVFSQIIKVNFLENVLTVGVYRKNILFCCSFVLSPLLFWRCLAAWWIIICHLWEWRRQWKVCVHVCVCEYTMITRTNVFFYYFSVRWSADFDVEEGNKNQMLKWETLDGWPGPARPRWPWESVSEHIFSSCASSSTCTVKWRCV